METDTIDLRKLFNVFRRRIWIIIISLVLCLILALTYLAFFATRSYTADVLLYIWQKSGTDTENSNSQYSDLLLFGQLVNDYQVLIKSRRVIDEVVDELQLSEEEAAGLADRITVSTKNNTRHIVIAVEDIDPEQAAKIANQVSAVFSRVVVENMGAGSVNIIDQAIPPHTHSSPNEKMILAIGLLLGLALGVMLSLLVEFLDNRVRSADDVEALTGYRNLGLVPIFDHNRSQWED